MEATLQRTKPKKHRTKTIQPLKTENDLVAKSSCDFIEKLQDKEFQTDLEETINLRDPSEIEPLETVIKECIIASNCERNVEKCTDNDSKNIKLVSNSVEERDQRDNVNSRETIKINYADNFPDQISIRHEDLHSSINTICPEKVPLLQEVDITKVQSLYMYPDLKSLQLCEQMHNIVSSQTLVRTYIEECKRKIVFEANKGYQEFQQVIHDLDKHPLMEMVHQYQRAKKFGLQLCSRIKYLKSNLKRKKDSLWKSVKKEASAKGRCEDGYMVNVKHTYTIKEIDEDKFNDVKHILKEIEELLLSYAFQSYTEKVMKLKIEHYIYDLVENEESDELKECLSMGLSGKEQVPLVYKKCISVLFDSQRQNVQDKHYLNTCQNWLKILATKLMQNGDFRDNLFLLNHVIRCPNGIQNWAADLIQVPVNINETEKKEILDDDCAQQILLALFLILNPVPFKDFFLKHIKESAPIDSEEGQFIVLDSEGEEEDMFEMSKKWSDSDIVSLLNQIPVRSLLKHFLLGSVNNSGELEVKQQSESSMLKLFAYSTAIVDILFTGLQTYYSESFPLLFESISNLIRHILMYISEYWINSDINVHFKSQIQAVYDKLFFHIVFKIYNFEKIHVWNILPSLPYNYVSEKMLWNILWIFFSPGRTEEQIYSEKDVEMKIKEESVHSLLVSHIRNFPPGDIILLLTAIEKIINSNNSEEDLMKFSYCILFKITVLETSLVNMLCNEGSIILRSISERYPFLVSVLIKKIDENEDVVADHCIKLFKKMSLSIWIPDDNDISVISSWLFLNMNGRKSHLARLILKNMNWSFNNEGLLFLPYDLHMRIAMVVTEAYLQFDANNSNEGLISKGVKQILQFTSIGGQKEEEEFVHWAWNILFSLKLHPLDRKNPPWVEVYDGHVEECNKTDITSDIFSALLSAYEKRHPSSCYLIVVIEGYSIKNLLDRGLDCFSALVESEQYMAGIKSLYYILPFFVKHSEQLLEKIEFMKALSYLITADLTVLSNITGEPVIGAVLHQIAAMIKYQIYQAGGHTVECSVPLLKLWIKILLKLLSPPDKNSPTVLKNSSKQVYFLLDVLVKISFLDDYTRDCTLDLLNSYCSPLSLMKTSQSSLWSRMFGSNSCIYAILNRYTVPEYPWLGWFVLLSEMKQKIVQDLWLKMQTEMMKPNGDSTLNCLKKICDGMKVDLEFLPIYRWASQAVETPVTHPVLPLIWQQFFLYYFHKVPLSNSSENCESIGIKYFKSGPFVTLIKKIKKHLVEAQNFYRNLLKTPEFECIQAAEEFTNENGLFYLNLNKLFHAFYLWIDDESLLSSTLCLSALDPKYCPYRLKLILNGDQNIWYDMASKSTLKDVIDQKVHSWCFNKIPNEVIITNHKNKESLPNQIIRHLENYETVLPAATVGTKPISVIAFEVNDSALRSKETILQLIEQNQSIIFDKAKYFCEQMKYLKQLNFNFINWVPQEYEVEDYEISEIKDCGRSNGCSGPAFFRLQIQKYKLNQRISERIDNNRADYLIVQDQLSKLPVSDLCTASLCIENLIRSLAEKIKNSKNERDSNYYRKMGIALFYHQISMIDKTILSVADYPASRQFFSSIIESLGREFIEGNELELTNLAESVLNYPEAGSLALPLFNPNKSDIQSFLNVYKTLTSAVGKHSANTLLALFSKIDFPQWLNKNSPNLDDRKVIFSYVCNALLVCGFSPTSELLPVFYIIKRHFGIILQYMFPELFLTTVMFLLNGIENKNLSLDVYYEAFHCFGCPLFGDKTSVDDIEFALRKFAQNQQLPADQQIFVSVARLNLQQVTHVSRLLYSHFMRKRHDCVLYKHYVSYIKPLGIFLAIISHSLIALRLEEISCRNEAESVSNLWETFNLPFWPWLHPSSNSSGLDFPWTEQELLDANYLFKIFTSSLKYFHEEFLSYETDESVLSCMWNFYVQIYVTPGYRHFSSSLCHSELLNLPWHQFHPCTHDIEGMCKVLQSNLQESKEFLSKISLKIPWSEVMKSVSLTKPPAYIGKVLATLGKLLIISQLDCTETGGTNGFKEFEGLSWHLLSTEEIDVLLNLFYSSLDMFLLVSSWGNSSEYYILQFLKLICCMTPNPDAAAEYSNSKRILYLQKFLTSLSDCCISKKSQMQKLLSKFKDVISSLFGDIEFVICNGVNPSEQVNYALPLVKETIVFINKLPEGQLDAAALSSITSWLSANKQSPLLFPVLKASSVNLNTLSHMVVLIECCISTRFNNEVLDLHETQRKWQLISSYFSLNPNLFDVFVNKCVEKNSYLTLYCCLLHKLPHSHSTESKKNLVERINQWIRESKLSPDAEAKFILLWDKLLELSIKLVSEEEFVVVRQELTSFCWILEKLAEDRSNSGLFAIIGFGQSSSLSVNFRFLCRVMAAFIEKQIPANCKIRMEPMDASGSTSSNESSASKALENLKSLQQKKLYSALQSQIDYASKCVLDPNYTFLQTRELLKYFAVVLYPKDSYLTVLDS